MSLVDLGFNTTVQISHPKPLDLGATNRRQNREVAQALADLIQANATGAADQLTLVANQSGMGAKAGATLLYSGSSGAVGGIINGVTVTAAHSSDVADGALVATAINASVNALVQGFVRASGIAASATFVSMAAGGTISLRIGSGMVASTYVFTATAAATSRQGEFSIAGSDTADAQAFCDALNAMPGINQVLRAENVAGVAFIYAMDGSASNKVLNVSGTGITATTQFAAVARTHIEALMPDARGNAITIALSGTGVTVANANTRLVGGAGGTTGTTKRAVIGGAQ
jgi:hypothetical protein